MLQKNKNKNTFTSLVKRKVSHGKIAFTSQQSLLKTSVYLAKSTLIEYSVVGPFAAVVVVVAVKAVMRLLELEQFE